MRSGARRPSYCAGRYATTSTASACVVGGRTDDNVPWAGGVGAELLGTRAKVQLRLKARAGRGRVDVVELLEIADALGVDPAAFVSELAQR